MNADDLEAGRPEKTRRRADTSLDAQSLEAGWLRLQIRVALQDLTPEQSEAIQMRYLSGDGVRTYDDIAEDLGITKQAARQRCERAFEEARKSEAFSACMEFLQSCK